MSNRPRPDCPLVVAYGLGVNSTAMLVEFVQRDIRPDMILFADTAGEKPETYAYMLVIQRYLRTMGFPPVETVRYEPVRARYRTLEEQCLHTKTLPSLGGVGTERDRETQQCGSLHDPILSMRTSAVALGCEDGLDASCRF